MKKYTVYFLILAMAFSWLPQLNAQTEVKLKINHKLGANAFAKSTQTQNNLNHNFTITRLEYYLSNIMIVHDGGQLDTFIGKYLLMDPSGASETISLGSLTFTNIESIQFSVGVDKENNHLNPAAYSFGHPLAPKSPSMHWGWSAGYRFIAIEGKSGTNMNQTYELHGLGDENYFSLRIPVTATDDNGAKVVELNADYTQVLHEISLNSGVVAHGENTADLKALQNMRDSVFTNTTGQGDILSVKKALTATITSFPNPVKKGHSITLNTKHNAAVYYKVYDLTGKWIMETSLNAHKVELQQAGTYQVQAFTKEHVLVANQKLVVIN